MKFTPANPAALTDLRYDQQGLIPAIIQDVHSGQVLMLAYMNQESLQRTLDSGRTCFYSRSRQQLWLKGETSGHWQDVRQIDYDCDADTLLIQVDQTGVACHEGTFSCFQHRLADGETGAPEESLFLVLTELFKTIKARQQELPEGSYTTYLFTKGQDKILKKVGEEAAEVIIASKNNTADEVVYETADLFYHVMVLLAHHGLSPADIARQLAHRRK